MSDSVSFVSLAGKVGNYSTILVDARTGPSGPPGTDGRVQWRGAARDAYQADTCSGNMQHASTQNSDVSWMWECGEHKRCWPWDSPNPLIGPMWLIVGMIFGYMLPTGLQCNSKNPIEKLGVGSEIDVPTILCTINLLRMWWGPLIDDPLLDLLCFFGLVAFQVGVLFVFDVLWGSHRYLYFPELVEKRVNKRV